LLEAMQERQVTIGEQTYPLPDSVPGSGHSNPIEQEGTYQLPEAQLDRFMFKLNIGYPQKREEAKHPRSDGDFGTGFASGSCR